MSGDTLPGAWPVCEAARAVNTLARPPSRLAVSVLFAMACVIAAPGVAAAAEPPVAAPSQAEQLFRAGREDVRRGDQLAACDKFRQSYELNQLAVTLLNIAECERKLDRIASAWGDYRRVAKALPSDDKRAAYAARRAAELEARVPWLTLSLASATPDDTRVLRDGDVLDADAFDVAFPVDPGRYVVVVEAPGHEAARYEVVLREGGRESLVVRPGVAFPQAADLEPLAPEPPPLPLASDGTEESSTLGWVVGGVGVASLGVSLASAIMAKSENDAAHRECDQGRSCQAENDSGQAYSLAATITFALGAAGVAAGTWLILSTDDAGESSVAVGPTLSPTTAGAALVGRF